MRTFVLHRTQINPSIWWVYKVSFFILLVLLSLNFTTLIARSMHHFSTMIILLIKISSFICRTDVFWNSRFCQHVCIFFVLYENAILLKSLNHYAFASLELFGMAISALVLLRRWLRLWLHHTLVPLLCTWLLLLNLTQSRILFDITRL